MSKTIIHLYRSKSGWHWQMRDFRNKKIIGASTESYRRRVDAVKNLMRVVNVGNYFYGLSGRGNYEQMVDT